jgi:hypothetical protein
MTWVPLEVDVVELVSMTFDAWGRLGKWLVASEEQSRVLRITRPTTKLRLIDIPLPSYTVAEENAAYYN